MQKKKKKFGKNVFEHTFLAFSNKKNLSHSITLEEHIVNDQREFLLQSGY